MEKLERERRKGALPVLLAFFLFFPDLLGLWLPLVLVLWREKEKNLLRQRRPLQFSLLTRPDALAVTHMVPSPQARAAPATPSCAEPNLPPHHPLHNVTRELGPPSWVWVKPPRALGLSEGQGRRSGSGALLQELLQQHQAHNKTHSGHSVWVLGQGCGCRAKWPWGAGG